MPDSSESDGENTEDSVDSNEEPMDDAEATTFEDTVEESGDELSL